jgi:diaminopimelate epimerase
MKTIPFIKMHGLGNDYVYIDCFPDYHGQSLGLTAIPAFARSVSDRHFGIGSDGLVLILPSKKADARMRIFNADGSEAEMCGNAIRCVAKYLYESGICRHLSMEIETLAGIRTLALQVASGIVEQVTVNMGIPVIRPEVLPCGADSIGYTSVNMGNPHAVFFRDAIPQLPNNTNVEFVRVHDNKKELDVRVIERGSGETLACGTGACAAAVAAMWHGLADKEVTVHLPGGDLRIRQESADKPVYMTGPATEVFRGEYTINS